MRGGSGATSHESAGVVWELPLYRHTPAAVHITMPTGRAHVEPSAGCTRHSDSLPDDDITTLFGIRCTTLDRTVFDLVRTLTPEAAISVADAALRQIAMVGNTYDADAAETWRQRMLERCARAKGVRGIRQATQAIRFADGRAELPGESVSRRQLSQLGFRRLGLQVPVPGPHGTEYRVDIEIEDVRTFFEFDGLGKYLDEATRSGRTIEQVMLDEKRREDWIRGTTQKRLVRVESPHILTTTALAARLAAFGITPPDR